MTDPVGSLASLRTLELKRRAHELGFVRCGVAHAEEMVREKSLLQAWVDEGFHASMDWFERTVDVRADPRHEGMLASAKNVVVVAAPYAHRGEEGFEVDGLKIARYAKGRDYHNVLHKRLNKLAKWLREEGFVTRVGVDSMPILERGWAERSGIGFVGKNSCLIVPGLGSHLFLAAMVTEADLVADQPMRERCGTCRACLDACPTKAFAAERRLDARRCISYLTIEHQGPIAEEFRNDMGSWAFGCDDCQDICPFNRASMKESEPLLEAFEAGSHWKELTAADLLQMEDDVFKARFEGTPLRRAGAHNVARNVALALGNSALAKGVGRRHLPVLASVAQTHASPMVREAAAWAEQKLSKEPSHD